MYFHTWAVDIPHVNYLQFLSVDRLGSGKAEQETGKTLWKIGVLGGSPSFQTRGFLGVCLSHPYQGGGSCFLGGHPISPPGQEPGGALPQWYPGRPLTPGEGICVSCGKLCTRGCQGLAVGRGRGGNRPPAGSRARGVVGPWGGAG